MRAAITAAVTAALLACLLAADPPAADPDVTELAAALANLPTDTLAALRAALGIGG